MHGIEERLRQSGKEPFGGKLGATVGSEHSMRDQGGKRSSHIN